MLPDPVAEPDQLLVRVGPSESVARIVPLSRGITPRWCHHLSSITNLPVVDFGSDVLPAHRSCGRVLMMIRFGAFDPSPPCMNSPR